MSQELGTNPFQPGRYSHQVFEACAAAGLNKDDTLAILLDDGIAARGAEAAAARAKEVGGIRMLCAFVEQPELGDDFVAAGVSEEEARKILINARADAADALHTDGHFSSQKDLGAAVASTVYRHRKGMA